MRVSKVVKEHITKRVNAVYTPRINEIDLDYKAKKEEIIAKVRSFVENAEKEVQAILADNCETWNFSPNYGKNVLSFNSYIGDYDMEMEYRNKKDQLRAERDEKIEEIIVELELGGNKETLEKMLAEL